MPLKILQLVPEALPTYRADVATLFGKYLPRAGVECDVVGMAAPNEAVAQGFASVRRPRYGANRLQRELAFLWLCVRVLAGANKRRYALIQVRDMVSIGLLALCVARLRGVPFCYWVSFLMSEGRIARARAQLAQSAGLRNRLVLWKGQLEQAILYRLVLPRADHVFVQSEAMAAHMVARGIAAARLTAVPMGVDMELFGADAASAGAGAGAGAPVLAYLGSLDKERELTTLVDALGIVRRRIPGASLLLVGAASKAGDSEALLAYAAAAGLAAAVRVTGWLPSAEAWRALRGADAAVSYVPRGALYDVSSPTKLLEYMALGMPAVGNDIPDQAHVLNASDAGWLTESNAEALAAAVLNIFEDLPAARVRAAAGPAYIRAARSYRVLADLVAQQYLRIAGRRT